MTKKDLVSALGEPLASQITGGAMANVEIIDALSSDQKLVARQAIYESLRTVWIMLSLAADGKGHITNLAYAVSCLPKCRSDSRTIRWSSSSYD
jgi:hypothetical protein